MRRKGHVRKMDKLTGIVKVTNDAITSFNKAVDQENWSEANTKGGYMNGAMECEMHYKNHDTLAYSRNHDFAEWNCGRSIETKDYGLAAYWRAYLNGWQVAETALRLDELQKQEKP